MIKKKLILLGIFILISVAPIIMGANVTIRSGSCQVNETFLFSVFQPNDTHISVSQDFFSSNYSVCYPKGITVNLRDACIGENPILSLYQPNNTHVSVTRGYFNYSLCSSDIICELTTTCLGVIVGSLYQKNDSHWGDVNYFNQTLCCVDFREEGGGGGGGGAEIEVEEPVEPIEPEIEVPKITIRKIAEKIKEIGKELLLMFFMVLFIVFVYTKKERCYYCRKKFKKKSLFLYKNKTCCKNCYKLQKAKE